MHIYKHHEQPIDLRSNFFTHSYFNVLEEWALFCSNPHLSTPSRSLIQALQSFLFITQNNSSYVQQMSILLFSHYTSFEWIPLNQVYKVEHRRSPQGAHYFAECKYKLSFPTLYKCYSKHFLKLKKNHHYDKIPLLNESFIHLHRSLIYSYFESEDTLPLLFNTSNLEDFIAEVKNILIQLDVATPM